MDRNGIVVHLLALLMMVALRKESVDRNIELLPWGGWGARSLSARRAWIEINVIVHSAHPHKSLSARRAWIEINIAPGTSVFRGVALRKESVDRNVNLRVLDGSKSSSRSPQGERG